MAELAGKIVADFQYHIDSFVENNKCFGLNGHDEKREFVPTVALTEFWTREKITTVLCSPKDMIKQSADTIFKHYLISFSVLVLNLNAESINLFIQEDLRDTQLPLPSVPEVYSDSASCGVFEEFIKRQWKFCPMSLDCGSSPKPSRRNLLPQRILPIVAKEKLNPEADEDGEQAVLFKVDLHPLCSQLGKPVVFKEYRQRTHETQRLFTNECDLYKQLREDSFGHIVTYYGSFECLGRSTNVLEFAPGGTLLSFFESRQPPRTDEQRKLFWGNLFGLFRGLQCIEDFTADHRHSRHTYRLKGTHQDIRPQNILVCGASSDEDYSAPFKFVDMGIADILKMRDGGYDRHAIDQRGNGMYSPPEACRDEGVATDIGDKKPQLAVDCGTIADLDALCSCGGDIF
ncbi:hypothetical protein C8034_v002826 [Colletotrichum sidae]|uniref:Protein kinase domain-containing protein n=1 Tax=Colletotrichum sidae TaxID=1347389 RepID=A0A4R8TB82_9PEZI|nr:hypothetical protein C8034_v002826 [Colletotrichum sidae]